LDKTEVITVKSTSSTTNLKLDPDVGGKTPAANCLQNGMALHIYVSTEEGERVGKNVINCLYVTIRVQAVMTPFKVQ
jgi:hypothetical protein